MLIQLKQITSLYGYLYLKKDRTENSSLLKRFNFVFLTKIMKAASLNEIKKELKTLSNAQLLEISLQLAKYKKENKELLTYLLFEAHDEASYIKGVKEIMDEMFSEVNRHNLYLAKKVMRKILSVTNKHIKYSGKKQTEVELLIYYCKKLKATRIKYENNMPLNNIYNRQLIKIGKSITQLHEDLQYDFMDELKPLL